MRFLITNNHLTQYAGSEIVVLEMTEALMRLGHNVEIATNTYGAPIREEFEKTGVKVHIYPNIELSGYFDVAWIHHQLIPSDLVSGKVRVKRMIFHHMSPYLPIELPFIPSIESELADLVLANSPETKRELSRFLNNEIQVIHNPSPSNFYNTESSYNGDIREILVVSNHTPKELIEALSLLTKDRKITYDHLGSGGIPERLNPKKLNKYDLVISIGKTVQYCILSKKPIYVYDHFGGPGFLTKSNYSKAKDLNFSGRGFQKKTPNRILKDIQGYNSSQHNEFLRATDKDLKRFDLDILLKRMIDSTSKEGRGTKSFSNYTINSLASSQDLIGSMSMSSNEQRKIIAHQKNELSDAQTTLSVLKRDLSKKEKEIVQLKSLKSYILIDKANRIISKIRKK